MQRTQAHNQVPSHRRVKAAEAEKEMAKTGLVSVDEAVSVWPPAVDQNLVTFGAGPNYERADTSG